jgi:epoxyqueuosine reductase
MTAPAASNGDGTAIREAIRHHALALGFDAVGFAAATGSPDDQWHLAAYLREGRHGDMAWMATTADRRADPAQLWPEANTIICLGVNYGPVEPPQVPPSAPGCGVISVYAAARDYHKVVRKLLKQLGGWLVSRYGGAVKVFVDTAPVMEKPLAQRAGIGWIGKHTNLVSRRFGSWLILGEVFTTLTLDPDPPEIDHCGRCRACLDACPTGALPEPYRIEPRRCLSYLTIEHRGAIAADLAAAAGPRIYGCDDCLAVCPWNKFATPGPHPDLQASPAAIRPRLDALAALSDSEFRQRFRGSAIRRTGHARFLRNVALAAANDRAPAA